MWIALSIVAGIAVALLGFVWFYVLPLLFFFLSIKRQNAENAAYQELSRHRLEKYPALPVTDKGLALLDFPVKVGNNHMGTALREDVVAWCRANISAVPLLINAEEGYGRYYSFATEDDAFAFKMRWL